MAVITVLMSEAEKASIIQRAKEADISSSALVSQHSQATPIHTAQDLLDALESRMGDVSLASKCAGRAALHDHQSRMGDVSLASK